jgi:DNA-binding GntR family transcriptional regulator
MLSCLPKSCQDLLRRHACRLRRPAVPVAREHPASGALVHGTKDDGVATASFTEVRGQPLSAVVLRTLREAIVEGRLAPGEAINEAQLSRQLGVSRAPVREALRWLEKDGLVVNVPYRGAIVTPLTERSMRELQAFRRLLEVFAAEQVLARATDADVASLEELVAAMERCAEAGDLDCMNGADVRFHTRIIELSGNELVLDVWESYVPRIRRALALRNRANSDLGSIVALHRDLTAAFRARNLDAVKRCYEMHGADIAVALQPFFELDGAGVPPGGVLSVPQLLPPRRDSSPKQTRKGGPAPARGRRSRSVEVRGMARRKQP